MSDRKSRAKKSVASRGTAPTARGRGPSPSKSRGGPRRATSRSAILLLGALLVGMLLAALGIVLLRGQSLSAGAIAIVVGLAMLAVASGRLKGVVLSEEDLGDLARTWLPSAVLILAIFFSIVACYEVAQPQTVTARTMSMVFWLLSLAALVGGVLWLQRWLPRPAASLRWMKEHGREVLLVLGILVLAFGARLYALNDHPYPWSGDEGTVGMEAEALLKSEAPDVFNVGWSGVPRPAFYPTAIAVAAFGKSILSVRLTVAIIGGLTVLFLYLLGRELFDPAVALVAAAFLVSFPFHLQFSRVGVPNIQDAFVVTVTLWLVMRAVHREQLSAYLWAGLASGLTLYAYLGGRLVLALAIAGLAYVSLQQKGFFRSHVRHLGVYLGATLVTLAPMVVFFVQHIQDFNSRLGQVSILQNGWLAREVALPGRSLASVLVGQFKDSTLVFISQPAISNFFNSPQPYLTPVASFLFLIGMAYAFQQFLKPQFLILLAWFWAVVVLGGVLTVSPPANTRMIMTAPAVALLVALGLVGVVEILSRLGLPATWQKALATIVLVFLVVQNGAFYFGAYRAGYYFDDANAEVAMHAGTELASLGPNYTLCLIGLPRMYSGFPTIPFLAPANPRTDIDPAQVSSAILSGHLPAFVVATPDNLGPLLDLAERYPGGRFETVPSTSRKETLYYAYIIGAP